MTSLKIIRYPSPILTQVSVDCTEEDLPLINESFEEMCKVMSQLDGVGLAAVQVGILKRWFLLKNKDGIHIIINPVILETEEKKRVQEGCLSLPYFYEPIDRYDGILMTFKNKDWQDVTAVMYGIEAQCCQHEIGHLDGKLILNDVSPTLQNMWKKKAKKKGIL